MSLISRLGPDASAPLMTDWQVERMKPARFVDNRSPVLRALSRATWRDWLILVLFGLNGISAVIALAIVPSTSPPAPRAASGAHSLAPATPRPRAVEAGAGQPDEVR